MLGLYLDTLLIGHIVLQYVKYTSGVNVLTLQKELQNFMLETL